jgi:hypothetical protein
LVVGEISGGRKKMLTWPDEWDPHIRERKRNRGYRFGRGKRVMAVFC